MAQDFGIFGEYYLEVGQTDMEFSCPCEVSLFFSLYEGQLYKYNDTKMKVQYHWNASYY